jgi:hypothetical protein
MVSRLILAGAVGLNHADTLARDYVWDALPSPHFRLTLRDTTVRAMQVSLTRSVLADTAAQVAITYVFPGFAQPNESERRRWAAVAGEILTSVREACAPGAPVAPMQCRRLGPPGSRHTCGTY